MFLQIAIGTGLLLLNITLAAISAIVLEGFLLRAHRWLLRPPHRPKLVLMLVGVSLWVLAVVTIGVWIWALAYVELGAFGTLEEAVYFSLVSYTTLGLGDLVPVKEWRLLAGMEAANGFLNFGLLTALLIEGLRQVRLGQIEHRMKKAG
jgi:hypothetical protein